MSQQTFWLLCETKNNSQVLWLPLMSTPYVQNIHIVIAYYLSHLFPSWSTLYIWYDSNHLGTCYFATQHPLLLPNGSLNFIMEWQLPISLLYSRAPDPWQTNPMLLPQTQSSHFTRAGTASWTFPAIILCGGSASEPPAWTYWLPAL